MSLSELQSEPFLLFRLCKPGGLPVGWFRYLRHDNFHVSSAYGTSDCRPFFQFSGEQAEGINPEHHLQKADEFFAAGVQKSITPGSAKSLWQNMEHEQVEKIFSGDGPGSLLAGFGMEIPEGDHAVFALEDILFPNDAPV